MREIKFRGKDDALIWHYGDLVTMTVGRPLIIDSVIVDNDIGEPISVDPATVGQFTGLYDTDGREIYEGDVLGNKYTSHYKFANAVVEWSVDGWLADCFSLREFLKLHTCIVVGNIYDNSELLPELPEEDDARD